MGPLIFVLLLSVVALGNANISQNEFISTGKEVVFRYESQITVRTDQPASYASLYGLQAKVYVQKTQEDTLMVRLDKIVFNLENGPVRLNVTNGIYMPIPTEAEELSLPFAIKYDSNKLVTAVIVESNDKEWSYNIKKSIASIFQFNSKILSTFDRKESHVEYSTEQTIYGLCNITYDVLPRGDHVTVVKTADPKECGNHYNLKRNLNFLDVDSNRVFKINQKENKGRVEMIEARGDIVIAVFRATAEMQSLKVYQRFIFVKEVAITNPIAIQNQLVLRSLKYEDPHTMCRDEPIIALADITGGRAKYNNNDDIPKVLALLDQLLNSLQGNQLTLAKPDYKVLQPLQHLYEIFEKFDFNALEHLSAVLQEKSPKGFKLFVLILPNIGTKSSAVLTRNLIRKEKIDGSMAVRVLRDFPARVRCPNEKLLSELEDMLTIDKEGSRVHVASVLAYASLIKRTYLGVDENSAVLEKFVKLFMQKFQSSKDYKIQVLYLHALGNIGMESVIHNLAPILTGEMEVERNLRSLALWAVAPLLQKNSSLMIKYIWPILSDRELDVSIRIAAYDIYVRTEKPTLNRFMQLYWLMRDETNEPFYNFHYNTMVTITQLQYVSNNENQIIEIARAILRMSRHPFIKYENEGIFVRDFIDKKSGLGGKVDNLYSLNHGNQINIRSKIMSRVYGFDTEMFSLHFGVSVPNYANINSKESITKYIELIIRREGRVVMVYVEDKPTPSTFLDIFKDLGVNIETKGGINIETPYLYERIMPTDFGVPIRMYELLTHMQTISVKMDAEQDENIKIDFEIKSLTLHNLRFNVYNPINDIWHGIEQNKHINAQFGFSISASKTDNDLGNLFKIRINKLSNGAVNGLQVHGENLAFIKGENAQELLVQFHKDSFVRKSVIRGEDYTTNIKVYNKESNTLGHHIELKIFDCDRDISRGGLITHLEGMEDEDNSDSVITLELLRLYLSTLFQTGYGSCGYGIRFTTLETFDHIEFDITMVRRGDLHAFTFEIDVHGATKSVQNTNLATYHSNLNVTLSELQRNGTIKWWIVHSDQVNKEHKLDIDLRYSMKENRLVSNLILSLGEVDKLGVINLEVVGIRSEEQQRILKDRKITYNECRPEIINGKYLAPVSVECAIAHSNLNRYEVHISVNDVKNRMVQMILYHFNALRHKYLMYAERKSKQETNEVMPMHLYIDYPVFRKELDVTVDTPHYQEVYTGIPQYELSTWGFHDISLANIFFSLSKWDDTEYVTSFAQCVVSKDHVLTLNGNIQKYELTNEWTSYLKAITDEGEVYNIFVKNINGNRPLAIQVKIGTNIIEIIPEANEFVIKVNTKVVSPVVGKYTEEPVWSYLMVESPKMIMFSVSSSLHVIYDGRTLRPMIPLDRIRNFEGHCIQSQLDLQHLGMSSFFSGYVGL